MEPFKIKNGLKHGDTFSPQRTIPLKNTIINAGIEIPTSVFHREEAYLLLVFADDADLLWNIPMKMKLIFIEFEKEAEKMDLLLNDNKN